METTMVLAKVFGLSFVLIGLRFLINKNSMKAMMDDFFKSPALIYVTAIMMVAAGFFAVSAHNVWQGGFLTVLVTVMAWAVLVKGALYLAVPDSMVKFAKDMMGNMESMMMLWALIVLGLGVYMGYMGFFSDAGMVVEAVEAVVDVIE